MHSTENLYWGKWVTNKRLFTGSSLILMAIQAYTLVSELFSSLFLMLILGNKLLWTETREKTQQT